MERIESFSDLRSPSPDKRLILALDVASREQGLQIAQLLDSQISFYKIGLSTLANEGILLAKDLKKNGKKIFLDLKLFDIGKTIETAVHEIAQTGCDFLTVHGDPAVVRAAVQGRGNHPLQILAVTILTSLEREDLDEMLIGPGTITEVVTERARRALIAGADGLILSPLEITAVRSLPEACGKLIVTPGIRSTSAVAKDQKRSASAALAIQRGADYLVIGRPILQAADPLKAIQEFHEEIQKALETKNIF